MPAESQEETRELDGEFEPVTGIRIEDQLEAVRLVALYLVHVTPITVVRLDELLSERRHHDSGQGHASERPQKFQSFLERKNTSLRYFLGSYRLFRDVVKSAISAGGIVLPSYLHDLAIIAGVLNKDTSRIPRFIDTGGLLEASGGFAQIAKIVRQYQGCWRTYRLSSRSSGSDERINVSFLNIHPLKLIKGDVPQFSYYQRSEDGDDDATAHFRGSVSKSYGVIAHTGECVSLVGERSKTSVGLGYLSKMTWRHVESGDTQNTPIFGVSQGPNSEAQKIVGAYWVAAFIEKSDDLSSAQYNALKKNELAVIGASPWQSLKAKIQAPIVVDAIERMIKRSKTDSLFQI